MIPTPDHPRWAQLLCGHDRVAFKFLVVKLMVGRLRAEVSLHPETLPQAIAELHRFFSQRGHMPLVQADLRAIFCGATRRLLSVDETVEMIRANKPLLLAGDADLLASLPNGQWVGGSIPYFVTSEGGCCVRDQIFVDDLDGLINQDVRIAVYRASEIDRIYTDARANHVRFIIVPGSSPTHLAFAMGAPTFPGFASVPLIGWVSGVHMDDVGKRNPEVFDGSKMASHEDAAVVLETALPEGFSGNIRTVNPFTVDLNSPVIQFDQTSFSAKHARVNGAQVDFPSFLKERGHDVRFPLVGDYCGVGVNVSIQSANDAGVDFFAPVFAGITYRLALPLENYRQTLAGQLEGNWPGTCFNCVLNYIYGEIEGHKMGSAAYPCTFGEIAYQLINQTFVHLDLIGHN